jgi:hypothetical protein
MSKILFNNPSWRLGNQMFQYASGLGVSKKTGHSFSYNVDKTYLGKCFVLGSAQNEVSPPTALYHEPSFSFNENAFSLPKEYDIELQGYFQSEKYFKHCENLVRQDFFFKKNIRDTAAKKLPVGVLVSIHVRRGDYTKISDHHPMPTVEWYERAFEKFPNYTPVVFSDDIQWCKDNLSHLSSDIYFSDNEATDGTDDTFVDLCMMSMCNGHIIANSTYSWWGAWLGGGMTIAPEKWFGPAKAGTDWDDVYCENWEVLA